MPFKEPCKALFESTPAASFFSRASLAMSASFLREQRARDLQRRVIRKWRAEDTRQWFYFLGTCVLLSFAMFWLFVAAGVVYGEIPQLESLLDWHLWADPSKGTPLTLSALAFVTL